MYIYIYIYIYIFVFMYMYRATKHNEVRVVGGPSQRYPRQLLGIVVAKDIHIHKCIYIYIYIVLYLKHVQYLLLSNIDINNYILIYIYNYIIFGIFM